MPPRKRPPVGPKKPPPLREIPLHPNPEALGEPKKAPAKKAPAKKAPAKAARNVRANNPHTTPVDGDAEQHPKTPRKAAAKKAAPHLKLVGPIVLDLEQLEQLATAMAGGAEPERPPALQAAMLHQAGLSWTECAARTGYSGVAAVTTAVVQHYRQTAADRDAELSKYALQIELERLDALQAAHWEAATTGRDEKSANVVLKVMDKRGKYLGFEEKTVEEGSRTIIITGGPNMAQELEAAARAAHPHLAITPRVVDEQGNPA